MGRETLTQLTKHSYLITSYFVVKLVYAGNAIVQILLISAFVGPGYRLYGLHVVERLLRHLDWARLEHFPRVTLCEFSIRYQSRVHQYVTQSTPVHQYVVQCALSINLFNEKIFLFLWFWLVFVAVVTLGDLLAWLFRSLYWPGQVQYWIGTGSGRSSTCGADCAPSTPPSGRRPCWPSSPRTTSDATASSSSG